MQDFAHLKKAESAPYSLNRTKNKNIKYKLRHHEKKIDCSLIELK